MTTIPVDEVRDARYTGMNMPPFATHPESPESALRIRAAIDDRLDQHLFKALGDPTRLLVLSCLVKCGRPCSVTEIAECCAVDFSVVNRHMKVLAGAGVLAAEKHGRTVWYSARCGDLCDRLAKLIDAIAEWCPNLDTRRDRASGSPCCVARAEESRR
jgi:ArsR family transcriptional regulator